MKRSTHVLLLILVAAAALRFYRMDAQSLWSDEGASVAQSLRDLPSIAANAAGDIHPPLYYVLLHFWVMPFGTSEVGVRSLSAVLGVALVGLCYLLGKTLWDARVGLLAAAIAAINPSQVYYAQEARMYMLLTVLGALCLYALLRILRRPFIIAYDELAGWRGNWRRYGWHALYTLAMVLGLYTHYLFPVVILAAQPIWLFNLLRRRHVAWSSINDPTEFQSLSEMLELEEGEKLSGAVNVMPLALASPPLRKRALAEWLVPHVVALLAYAPWLPTAIRQVTTWAPGAQTFTLAEAPYVVLRTLGEGVSAPRDDQLWLLVFLVLALVGIWDRRWDGDKPADSATAIQTVPFAASLVPLAFLLAPIALMFALALFKDAFLKFLLIASPPFILLLADGIGNLATYATRLTRHAARVAVPVLLALLALPSLLSLQNYYFASRFARDDYRAIAQTITALAREGDAIILDAPGQQEIFNYYYRGRAAVVPLPRQRPPNALATEHELLALAAQHARLFVVLWATDESDPARVVESWLDAHTFKASDTWYGNVRLALYARAPEGDALQQPLDLRWGDALTLLGYTQPQTRIAAGEVLPLTLFWRADKAIGARYKVFVHLLDPRGFVVAQRDAEPVGGSRPTDGWQTGEMIRDPYGLFIPFGTPPLRYRIEVGVYDPRSGQRLKSARGDDHLLLDPIEVMRAEIAPPLAAYGMTPLDVDARNGLQLVGYRLDKLGAEEQRDVVFHSGDALHLTLFWRKAEEGAGDGAYRWQVGTLTKQTTPTDGRYAVVQWRDGEVVRDDQIIVLPHDWRAGRYAVEIEGNRITDVEVR